MVKDIPFEYWQPDEIAEAVENVPADLRVALWGFVGDYTPGNVTEDNPSGRDYPGEVGTENKLPLFWDRLSGEHQELLRQLQAAMDAEMDAMAARAQARIEKDMKR